MIGYMKKHEEYLAGILDSNREEELGHLREYHKVQIEIMQHERLVHLLVTISFAFFFLISVLSAVIFERPEIFPLGLLILALLVPYIIHYYKLENGVQKWYGIYSQIDRQLQERSGAAPLQMNAPEA
jgi:Ca2+/Na+ antiporter